MKTTSLIIQTFFFLIFALITGCGNNKEHSDKQSEADQYLNLANLAYYDPYQKLLTNKFDYVITKYLNISCPNCVDEIKKLSRINKTYSNLRIRLICYSQDSFLYFKYLIEENKFPQTDFPFFLDTADMFPQNNPNLKIDLAQTVIITDPKDKVLKIVKLDSKKIEEAINELK